MWLLRIEFFPVQGVPIKTLPYIAPPNFKSLLNGMQIKFTYLQNIVNNFSETENII